LGYVAQARSARRNAPEAGDPLISGTRVAESAAEDATPRTRWATAGAALRPSSAPGVERRRIASAVGRDPFRGMEKIVVWVWEVTMVTRHHHTTIFFGVNGLESRSGSRCLPT
jgi:hypothetical protein